MLTFGSDSDAEERAAIKIPAFSFSESRQNFCPLFCPIFVHCPEISGQLIFFGNFSGSKKLKMPRKSGQLPTFLKKLGSAKIIEQGGFSGFLPSKL